MSAPSEHLEVERKYDAGEGAPAFDELRGDVITAVGAGSFGDATTTLLDARYFDTDDLTLLAHRITLRRRTGGDDEGWHLKLPGAGDGRRELRSPLGAERGTVPVELLDQVGAYLRGRLAEPIAELITTRVEHPLLDAEGGCLARIAEDRVLSQRLVGEERVEDEWREVEVELVTGEPALLDVVEAVLIDAGLRRSTSPSKLSRALGHVAPASLDEVDLAGRSGRKATAGDVLMAELADQVERLLSHDAAARVDAPDAVHSMRVATRRLRSQLATCRPILDRSVTDPMRDELRWLGGLLGGPRDAEVQRERVLGLLDQLPDALVVGPVRARAEKELSARHRALHAQLVAALDSGRYHRLLARLDALLSDPPLGERASDRARDVFPTLVGKAAKRVDRAAPDGDPEAGDEALHLVRKAAKRARYAAESAVPVSGRQAERLAARMERLQDLLGEHQDAVTTRALLPELAAAATDAGESAYTFGVLHGVETDNARAALVDYADALRSTRRPKVRDWCR